MDTVKKKDIGSKALKVIRITSKVLLAIICLFVVATIIFRAFKKNKENTGSIATNEDDTSIDNINQYYETKDPFSEYIPEEFVYPPGSSKQNRIPGTNKCQLYTYENAVSEGVYNSTLNIATDTKPNINSVFLDYVNGLNHISGDFSCITPDQIEVINGFQECLKDDISDSLNICYDNTGSIIDKGTSYSYARNCSIKEPCKGILGNISLNFSTNDGFLSQNVSCIGVSTINVPSDFFNSHPNLSYYRNLGIFKLDPNVIGNSYPVTLKSSPCNSKNSLQKFLITRYNYGTFQEKVAKTESIEKTGFFPEDTGIYTSILFRPINSYLDIDIENSNSEETKLILVELSDSDKKDDLKEIKWITFPKLDISSNRYPILQKCNFIASTENNNLYSLISQPIPKDTFFVSSQFNLTSNSGGVKYLSVGSGYCSDPITTYPVYTFKNLTPNGSLNPFNFYNYKVLTKESNPPVQNSSGNFIIENRDPPRNFNFDETFRDGDAQINVENYANYIVQFPGEYFTKNTGSVLNISVSTPENSNSGDPSIYKESDAGLIDKIVVSKQPVPSDLKSTQYNTGEYTGVVPVSQTNSSGGTTSGTSCSFKIEVLSNFDLTTQKEYANIIVSVENPGINYSEGDILTINSSDIGLANYNNPTLNVSSTFLEIFLFKSIPMNKEGTLSADFFTASFTSFPTQDFSILGTFSNTGGFQPLNTQNDFIFEGILSRGFNFSSSSTDPNNNIFLMQLTVKDQNFINFTYQSSLTNFIDSNTYDTYNTGIVSIVASSVSDNTYNGDTPAPISLLPVNSTQDIQFNFLGNSDMILNSSNPQLIYGGENTSSIGTCTNSDLINTFINLKISNEKDLENLFSLGKAGGLDTTLTNLKSLQYSDIKYSSSLGTCVPTTNSKIVLGKFIPYSSFTPMTGTNNPPTTVGDVLYNENQFGIIPYGLDLLYQSKIYSVDSSNYVQ